MSLATAERAAICDTFDELGPDRATLCAGWNTADLLAHLLVRERQPAAAAGIVIGPLAGVTRHAMRSYATTPWADIGYRFPRIILELCQRDRTRVEC